MLGRKASETFQLSPEARLHSVVGKTSIEFAEAYVEVRPGIVISLSILLALREYYSGVQSSRFYRSMISGRNRVDCNGVDIFM